MTLPLRPARGGYLRPFGAGIFIRDFLAGEGPKYGTTRINPLVGAPQADIHAAYKGARHRAMAEDSAAWDAEEAIHKGKPMTPEQVEARRRFYLDRIPYKLTKMRYSSFTSYFSRLIKLGWVERTGKEEPSEAQENWPDARPRIYYRLTDKGRTAPLHEWSDPLSGPHVNIQPAGSYPLSVLIPGWALPTPAPRRALDPALVPALREGVAAGKSLRVLAREFEVGVSHEAVRQASKTFGGDLQTRAKGARR